MVTTDFGNFQGFCYEATLPVCNIFNESFTKGGSGFGGCALIGVPVANGTQNIRNLGSILLAGIAVIITVFFILRSERKKAAVGRREMQLFLAGYIVIEICEIFTVGGITQLQPNVVLGFTAVHLASIAATAWILLLNAIVGFQLLDDGTALSLGAVLVSAGAIFIGTGYISLDTAFRWTGHFDPSLGGSNNNIGLYVLYLLFPLICIVVFFALETVLVLRVLGERKPMLYLLAAAVLFALGQIFDFTISRFICNGTAGKIDGTLFETLFTLLSVVMIWIFWSSITEDDWPMPTAGGPYT